MNVYTERPKQRRARQVWDYVTKKRKGEPKELWKNPNCWGCCAIDGGGLWGWWVADYGRNEFVRYENMQPSDIPMTTPQEEL